MTDTALHEDLAANLRLLCSYYRSIAEVCRRLEINRPQFNRYLSGRYRPSASTLRRFCEFFGVEEHEILMPNAQFARLVKVRPRPAASFERTDAHSEHLCRLQEIGSAGLERYLGFYFETYLSMADPGNILRTLVCLTQRQEQVVYQRTERRFEAGESKACHNIYYGLVHLLGDRLFLSDYESLIGQEMTQTVLFPSFNNRVHRLTGLRLGASASGERMPSCARVVFEYLGPEVSVRSALRLCGRYAIDDTRIDAATRRAVVNDIAPGEWHFRARY